MHTIAFKFVIPWEFSKATYLRRYFTERIFGPYAGAQSVENEKYVKLFEYKTFFRGNNIAIERKKSIRYIC